MGRVGCNGVEGVFEGSLGWASMRKEREARKDGDSLKLFVLI